MEMVQSEKIRKVNILWYVIQTVSGNEEKCLNICKLLLEQTLYKKIFIPKYIAKIHYKKEWHDKEKILFPGYVFIDTENIDDVFSNIMRHNRHIRILKNAEKFLSISKEEQLFLESILNNEETVEYSEGFLIGDKVCVTSGSLRNYTGSIYRVDRHKRIAYLKINLFGRETIVEVGFSAVARLTEEKFDEIKENNIKENSKEEVLEKNQVKILDGIFEGMRGTFLCADADKDEWTILLKLFGSQPSRVVFHRNEIEMFSDDG